MRVMILGLALLSILALSQCTKRVSCNADDNERLGSIDYSERFKAMERESNTSQMTFSNGNETFVIKQNEVAQEERWLIDHKICESIDIKPYSAYAYYAYPDYVRSFSGEDRLLVIEAEIQEKDGERYDLLYFNWAEGNDGFKCVLPVGNDGYKPEGDLVKAMEYHSTITLADKEYNGVWRYNEQGQGLYYHPDLGVIAIQRNGSTFMRVE